MTKGSGLPTHIAPDAPLASAFLPAYTHAAFRYRDAREMLPWWNETPPIARIRFVHRLIRAAEDGTEASSVAILQEDDRGGRNLFFVARDEEKSTAAVRACLWHEEDVHRHVALAHLRAWWRRHSASEGDGASGLSFDAFTTADGLEWVWSSEEGA